MIWLARSCGLGPLAAACILLSGCGETKPYGVAPVSGRVTMDGQPLADARVTFFPQRAAGVNTAESAPEAMGVTDADGHYQLKTVFDDEGAAPGPSRVVISTLKEEYDPANPEAPPKVVAKETVPKKYFTGASQLEFTVPSQGTDSANFDLTSK
ncbi:MAG: carboxypeptidase regulatory-like domain-containing protein [Planctomycetes bacterium]|nr:carboxypeptidase regulatory-like domain-containing protein [Planctomycetota bacterium]